MSEFGKKRLGDFYLDPSYINVNHGSYGSCPRVVMEYKRKMEELCDFNTEKWFRGESQKLINEMRTYIASKVNCKASNLFIVQNATDAFNCVVKSMKWKEGDIVLLPNTAYSCVRKTLMVLKERYGIVILDINFTAADLQSQTTYQLKVENFVNAYPKQITLAVFDHIISVPAFIVPVRTLQAFFDQKDIPLIIDAAHAIGQTYININELQPQAYFSNFHKWAFAPKNAAFLYVNDEYLKFVRPVITGNFLGEGPVREYYWTGTRDFSSYLSIRKGFQYLQSFGQNRVVEYNHNLVLQAGKRMAEIWKTKLLTENVQCIGNLCNVIVPSTNLGLCTTIATKMMHDDNCYPIFFQFDGKVACRISAQIFNELSDYEFAATTFLKYLNAMEKKE